MRRPHRWDLKNAFAGVDHLPHQLIHNDANEHNVLVGADGAVAGLIDFGDVVWSARVCGLAVAGAYAMQGEPDPARAVVPVVRGYHEVTPLREDELAVLFELMLTRLRDERRDGLRAARRGAGQRLPADQPVRRDRGARAAGGRGRRPRALPLPRRLRLRGVAQGPARASDPRARDARAGHGRRLGRRAGARPGRRDAARRRTGDRPLRRGARDLHRARVPDPGRPPADAPHGGRPVRARGHSGLRAARRRRRAAREPRPAGRLRRPAGTPPRRLLDAARPSRSGVTGLGRGARGRGDRAAGHAGVNGGWEPHLHLQLFTDLVSDLPGRGAERRGRPVAQPLPGPEPAARTAGRRRRATRTTGPRGAPPGRDEPGALARLSRAVAHRPRARRVPLRRRRPRLPRSRQQRRPRRPLPPARGRGRRAADGGAEHEHALPARSGDRLRAGAGGDAPGPAARVLLRELGLGGQRPRAAARRSTHRPRGRGRARPRLSRASALADRAQPVQVQRRRRDRAAAQDPRRGTADRAGCAGVAARADRRAGGVLRRVAAGLRGSDRLPGRAT